MKKLIALSLTMALSFSLAACGSKDDAASNKEPASDSSSTADDTNDSADNSNADDTDSSTDDTTGSNTDDSSAAGNSDDSDLAYVKEKGTLVVGITDFEPMDYQDADGNWIGFDADMAKAFAECIGVTAKFV